MPVTLIQKTNDHLCLEKIWWNIFFKWTNPISIFKNNRLKLFFFIICGSIWVHLGKWSTVKWTIKVNLRYKNIISGKRMLFTLLSWSSQKQLNNYSIFSIILINIRKCLCGSDWWSVDRRDSRSRGSWACAPAYQFGHRERNYLAVAVTTFGLWNWKTSRWVCV